jgi:hypothetical protein
VLSRLRFRLSARPLAAAVALAVLTPLAGLGAAPASATTDTAAPNLTAFDFTPSTIDTSAGAQTITFTAHVTDDVSGLNLSSGTYLYFSSPSGRSVQATFSKRTSGTAQDGDYQGSVTLPRWSEQGTWRFSYGYLADAASPSHSHYYSTSDFTTAGFPTTFTQTGTGDVTAPTLTGFTITPSTIDTSATAQTLTLTAHVTDDASGLGVPANGYSSSSITINPPSGGTMYSNHSIQFALDASKRVSGTALDGVYRTTVTIPRYSEQGSWRVLSGYLTDTAGNSRSISGTDLDTAGMQSSFTQTGVGDTTPPALASLTISPASVDTSAAAQTVTVTARITDAVSGVGPYATSLWFSSPGGSKSVSAYLDASRRISGTAQDGTYQVAITVPRYSEQGTWRLNALYLNDVAGNSASYSASQLVDAGLQSSFDQTGIGDITPPVLSSFSFTPGTIDTGAAARTITVTAHITDDLSGLGNSAAYCCYPPNNVVSFTSPSGSRTLTATFDGSKRISGTAADGIYQATITVPRYAEQGSWRISTANFADAAGNTRTMAPGDFATAGFTTSFNQTAAGDSTAPILAGLSISPSSVDPSTSPQTVTVRAHITDAQSGVSPYGPSLYFASPALGQTTTASAGGVRLVSGTAQDAVLDIDVVVPRFAETGTWQLAPISLSDALGNSVTLGAADVSAAGFPTTFTVAALPPGTPTGVTAIPSNGSATVNWTEPAANGASPITSYTVAAYSGTTVAQTKTVIAPASSATITGLANGSAYTFTVAASNASGPGAPSAPSPAVTPRTLPGAPGGLTVTAGNGSAALQWTAPSSDGGSVITGYTVTTYSGSAVVQTKTVAAPATSATVTGLANGSPYSFTVAAINAAGTGPAVSSDTLYPRAPTFSPTPIVSPPVVTISTPAKSGYWMIGTDGKVYAFGDAPSLGAPAGLLGSAQAVDLEPTRSGAGYWVVDDLGRVYAYGDAPVLGNVDPARLAPGEKAISLSATKNGHGYWIFTTKGRVLPFGDAVFYGDMSAVRLNGPVIDSIPTATGNGYYMVGSDGGIFSFGDAVFHGSMGGQHLNAPVQSLVPTADGTGYWLVASDGGIFAFDAPFKGSLGNIKLNKPITGMVRYGDGYLMVAEDGGVFDFSGSPNGFKGSLGSNPPSHPIGSVAAMS